MRVEPDSQGRPILANEPGDQYRVIVELRPQPGYKGKLATPGHRPVIGVNHATGTYVPLGAVTPQRDGTAGMAERVAKMIKRAARRYVHLFVARDGTIYNTVPLDEGCIGTEGRYPLATPAAAAGQEINTVAVQMEWTSIGWVRRRDGLTGDGRKINTKRDDLARFGARSGFLWQLPTRAQAEAAAEAWAAIVAWSQMAPADALHGHYELAQGKHTDPGPAIQNAIDAIVRPRLGLEPLLRAASAVVTYDPFLAATQAAGLDPLIAATVLLAVAGGTILVIHARAKRP